MLWFVISASEESFRFLYFNHMNLALKASLSTKGNPLTTEVIKVLRSIHADFQKYAFRQISASPPP